MSSAPARRRGRPTTGQCVDLDARLAAPADVDPPLARRLLARAEETWLITRSLSAEVHLSVEIESADARAII